MIYLLLLKSRTSLDDLFPIFAVLVHAISESYMDVLRIEFMTDTQPRKWKLSCWNDRLIGELLLIIMVCSMLGVKCEVEDHHVGGG